MNQVSTSSTRQIFNIACFALFVIGLGVYFIGTPKMHDDYWFMAGTKYWYDAQGIVMPENGGNIFTHGVPWKGIRQIWEEHYLYDNARLSNILVTIFLIFPKWVGSGLMTVLFAWSVILTMRLSGLTFRSRLVPVALLLWTYLFPWTDSFGCMDFQFNYILPGWASLMLLTALIRHLQDNRTWICVSFFLLSLLVGLIHEGFAFPIFLSLIALAIFLPKWRSKTVIATMVGLLVATTILLLVPGMVIRLGGVVKSYIELPASVKFVVSFKLVTYLVMIGVVLRLIYKCSGIFRQYVCNSFLPIFCSTGIFAGCMLKLTYDFGDRIYYWVAICATILLLYTFKRIYLRVLHHLPYIPGIRGFKYLLLAVCLTLLSIGIYCLDHSTFALRKEMANISHQVRDGRNGSYSTFFLNLPYDPFGSCNVSQNIAYDFYLNSMLYYYSYNNSTIAKDNISQGICVPSELRNATALSGEAVGNAGNIRKIGNKYFIVDPSRCVYINNEYMIVHVAMERDGHRVNEWCQVAPFFSVADGRRHLWIYKFS